MILKYELLIVIILQIIIITFIWKSNNKNTRVWDLNWFLAIVSNVLHIYMSFRMLDSDLPSEEGDLFIKILVGLLLLLIFEICYIIIFKDKWSTMASLIISIVLQLHLISNIVLLRNGLFGIIVVEVNSFPLLMELFRKRRRISIT